MAANNPDRFHVWYVLEEPSLATTTTQPATAAAMGAAMGAAAAAAGAAPAGMAATAAAAAGAAAAKAAAAAGLAASWRYSKGWVTPDMLAQHLLPPRPVVLQHAAGLSSSSNSSSTAGAGPGTAGPDAVSLALMCGPPGMLENVVVPSLTALGFGPGQMVVF